MENQVESPVKTISENLKKISQIRITAARFLLLLQRSIGLELNVTSNFLRIYFLSQKRKDSQLKVGKYRSKAKNYKRHQVPQSLVQLGVQLELNV